MGSVSVKRSREVVRKVDELTKDSVTLEDACKTVGIRPNTYRNYLTSLKRFNKDKATNTRVVPAPAMLPSGEPPTAKASQVQPVVSDKIASLTRTVINLERKLETARDELSKALLDQYMSAARTELIDVL